MPIQVASCSFLVNQTVFCSQPEAKASFSIQNQPVPVCSQFLNHGEGRKCCRISGINSSVPFSFQKDWNFPHVSPDLSCFLNFRPQPTNQPTHPSPRKNTTISPLKGQRHHHPPSKCQTCQANQTGNSLGAMYQGGSVGLPRGFWW